MNVKKVARVIGKKSARRMYCWSFFKFKQRLKYRAENTDCTVAIQEERYTSKTCCACGNVKDNLGGNKTYNCTVCGVT
jgi:putative transposase